MHGKYSLWSFILCLFLLSLSFYSMYAERNQLWSIAPPISVLWVMTITTFVLGIIGLSENTSKITRFRSWLSIVTSFSLSVALFLGVAGNIVTREPIKTTQSPDSTYTIDFYTVNGGAATSIAVLGVIDGPLWFKKNIYNDMNMHKAAIEWRNNDTVIINNRTLHLNKGETFSN